MVNEKLLTALRELAEQHFGVDGAKMTPEASLRDVGIDSFQFVELVFIVEEKFGVAVNLEELHVDTVSDVVYALEELFRKRERGV